MKTASPALVAYLNVARGNPDVELLFADAYTFALRSGITLYYTNIEVTFAFSGVTYIGNSILIDGLKYKAGVALETDSQQITIAARSTDAIATGAPFLPALRSGAFDGAQVTRQRVFFSDKLGGTAIAAVTLFKGRVGTIDEIGRTSAKVTVNSDLILLDNYMPRNLYSATCLHTLYDSGCALIKASFGTNGAVGAGSTISIINWSGASTNFAQGTITFTSGANAGVSATVGSAVNGVSLALLYPLPNVPASGDAFTVYFGCDHTESTCINKFNNLTNFRAFPFVPPPQMAL